MGLEVINKLLVEEKGTLEETVDGFGKFDIQKRLIHLIVDNVLTIEMRVNMDHQFGYASFY
jgi:hypothetical protein